jgi:ligand-binding sensor protein
VAHQNVAAQVLKTRETVVDECDAGLMKFAVPIFVDDEFLGVAGGCGKLRGEGQVDVYLVHRTANLDEKVVGDLSGDIETIGEDSLESVINYVEKEVGVIIAKFSAESRGLN